MTSPRVSNIILRVADMERAAGFWGGTLGLTDLGGNEVFHFFDAGGVVIALNAMGDGDPAAGDSLTEVTLEVDDPRAVHGDWAAKGVPFEIELRPVMESEGRSLLAAHFRDPDGHLVSLTGWE